MPRRSVWVAVLVVAGIVGEVALPATAANRAQAQRATSVVADDLVASSLDAAEKKCITQAFTQRAGLASATARAGIFGRLSETKQAHVIGIVSRCAPDVLAKELVFGGTDLGDLDMSDEELRCIAAGFGTLDDAVLVATMRDDDLDELDGASQEQLLSMMFDCVPTAAGKAFIEQLASTAGLDQADLEASDAQLRCVGEGIVDAIGPGDLGSGLNDEPSLEFTTALVHAAARCTPDVLTKVLTQSMRDSGVPQHTAKCFAERIVADPELVREALAMESSGSDTPSERLMEVMVGCG